MDDAWPLAHGICSIVSSSKQLIVQLESKSKGAQENYLGIIPATYKSSFTVSAQSTALPVFDEHSYLVLYSSKAHDEEACSRVGEVCCFFNRRNMFLVFMGFINFKKRSSVHGK